jgi:hypothetical protein
VKSLTTVCGTCTDNLGLTCTSTETLHACKLASDCAADGTNNSCCPVDGYSVCLNQGLADFAGIKNCLM